MPIRSGNNRGGNIIGSFPSLKMPPAVAYESTIERDLLFFLEYDPTVRAYYPQPFVITHTDQAGVTHRYTPDFQVIRPTGKTVVECKPAALVDSESARRQIALGQAWADANDQHFVVITDVDLRSGPQLANLKLLWRYARLPVPPSIVDRCRVVLHEHPDGLPFSVLTAALADLPDTPGSAPQLYALLFRHILHTDLTQPLTMGSLIQVPLRTE